MECTLSALPCISLAEMVEMRQEAAWLGAEEAVFVKL